jgi:hypothetical protein
MQLLFDAQQFLEGAPVGRSSLFRLAFPHFGQATRRNSNSKWIHN